MCGVGTAPRSICTATAGYDFRYSRRSANVCADVERMQRAVVGIMGKRLTYRGPDAWAQA